MITFREILVQYLVKVFLFIIDGFAFVYGYHYFGISDFISLPTIYMILGILTINFIIQVVIHYLFVQRATTEYQNYLNFINSLDEWEETDE